jgi:hypothetical protein
VKSDSVDGDAKLAEKLLRVSGANKFKIKLGNASLIKFQLAGKCTGIVTRGIQRYVENLKRRLKVVPEKNRNPLVPFVHED